MIDEKPIIDLSKNHNQGEYFNAVMSACAGVNSYRRFAYGGAIRGGKTFVTLFILIILARKYPNSRWHIVRKDMPALLTTTIPSFEKFKVPDVRWNRNPGNFFVEFKNGSRIYFKPESIDRDPMLSDFLGLETNGLFLEQAEELSRLMWDQARQRVGSWYIDNMPPAFIFLTFNPTDTWPREVFYEPSKSGVLPDGYFYQNALPSDNPFVTTDQWAAWGELDEITRRMMVEGDWDARRNTNAFYFAFSRTIHVKDKPFNPELPVHLSFDQNVLPYISLSCWQIDGSNIHCFEEIVLEPPKATTGDLCAEFLKRYGNYVKHAYLYGDASGNKRDTRGRSTDYDIAKNALRKILNNHSDRTYRQNPDVLRRREFINAILSGSVNGIRLSISPTCKKTITDMHEVTTDANGHKYKKKGKGEKGETFEMYGHLSDTADYIICRALEKEYKQFISNRFSIVVNAY
jgi:hypothetical protein